MFFDPATPKAPSLDEWHVAKKIKPEQRGAIKLARRHGESLLCVRYRESPDGKERLTTVELVVERAAIQPHEGVIVWFQLKPTETALRQLALAKGARYDPEHRLWQLRRRELADIGLTDRITKPPKNPKK